MDYTNNQEQAVKAVKALKVGQVAYISFAFIVRKQARNDFRFGETHGDWLGHGTAEEVVARSFAKYLSSLNSQRDALIAEYETRQANGATFEQLESLGDAINALHDAETDYELAQRYVGSDKGEWCDRTSRWHY